MNLAVTYMAYKNSVQAEILYDHLSLEQDNISLKLGQNKAVIDGWPGLLAKLLILIFHSKRPLFCKNPFVEDSRQVLFCPLRGWHGASVSSQQSKVLCLITRLIFPFIGFSFQSHKA